MQSFLKSRLVQSAHSRKMAAASIHPQNITEIQNVIGFSDRATLQGRNLLAKSGNQIQRALAICPVRDAFRSSYEDITVPRTEMP